MVVNYYMFNRYHIYPRGIFFIVLVSLTDVHTSSSTTQSLLCLLYCGYTD